MLPYYSAQTIATEITVYNPYIPGPQKIDGSHLFHAEGELAPCELHLGSILTKLEYFPASHCPCHKERYKLLKCNCENFQSLNSLTKLKAGGEKKKVFNFSQQIKPGKQKNKKAKKI